MSSEIREFVKTIIAGIEPLARDAALAYWDFSLTSSEAAARRSEELDRAVRGQLSDPEAFRRLKAWAEDPIDDPLLAREVRLLLLWHWSNQMERQTIADLVKREKEIEGVFYAYRARVGGEERSDNELSGILREETQSALCREAWESSKQVGAQVAAKLRELVKRRNAAARHIGFANFYAMQIELQELNEKDLFDLLARLEQLTDAPFRDYKRGLDRALSARFGCPPSDLRPWHYADPFFQRLPEAGGVSLDASFKDKDPEALTRSFYRDLGLDIEDILKRSDLYEKPGKCQHAFCTDIDRRGDVRILANVVPGERWMGTMLHEVGHGVYDKYLDMSLPYALREPAHILATEAVAILMERFPRTVWFLVRYAGVPPEEARAMEKDLRAQSRAKLLIFCRWSSVMMRFEQAMYRDPDQDLDSLWWDLVERYQLLARPESRRAPDWAAKIHLSTSPVYYHNYLLGELAAAQLEDHIQRNVLTPGEVFANPKSGSFLVEKVFRPGSRAPWNLWLANATGEPLNPEHFARRIA